jgi:hypothetical protein
VERKRVHPTACPALPGCLAQWGPTARLRPQGPCWTDSRGVVIRKIQGGCDVQSPRDNGPLFDVPRPQWAQAECVSVCSPLCTRVCALSITEAQRTRAGLSVSAYSQLVGHQGFSHKANVAEVQEHSMACHNRRLPSLLGWARWCVFSFELGGRPTDYTGDNGDYY